MWQFATERFTRLVNMTKCPAFAKFEISRSWFKILKCLVVLYQNHINLYILNLIYHRLTPETYDLWCQLTERDVSFPEMSKQGILETNYKKNQRKAKNVSELNLTLQVEGQKEKVILPEILAN